MKHCILLFLIVLVAGVAHHSASAQTASFTYQGQLRLSGEPFTGMADLEFRLYDQLSAGTEIGSAQLRPDWPVEDGLFQVELDFGSNTFDGNDRFLEVLVDGAPLIPRQKVTATPYALLASGLASGSVGGGEIDPTEVQLRVAGTCPAGEYVQEVNQDGSVVCGVDADAGGTVTQVDTGAGLTGGPIAESGTISVAAGGIGATEIDDAQVQRRVAGTCPAGQYAQEVNQDGSVVCGVDALGNDWRLGGNAGTDPASDFLGTTDATPLELRTANARSLRIEPSVELFDGLPITANVIAGSRANEVAAGVRGATIAGGGVPAGDSDPDWTGEDPNRIYDHYGAIGGGYGNTAGKPDSIFDTASGFASTVGGGRINTASGTQSTVGGGYGNTASGIAGTVGGGLSNTASGERSTVGGGRNNTASHFQSTVSGGYGNTASGTTGTVGGGSSNTSAGIKSTVSGGSSNTASGTNSTVGGGGSNTAHGGFSTVSGGSSNCAGGSFSWAGGRRAKVRPGSVAVDPGTGCDGVPLSGDTNGDEGSFIWADVGAEDFISTGPNRFLVRAAGGVGLGTSDPLAQLHVTEAINGSASLTNHVAIIENIATSTGNGPDVLALKTSAVSPSATANLITFFDGNDDALGRIDGDGSGGVVFQSGGADFAEWLPRRDPDANIQPGDVVGWHADGISHDTRDALRVMAISSQPIIAGNAPPEEAIKQWARVGFIGQVPVRVRGPVSAGDWIVASGRDDGTGVAIPAQSIASHRLAQVVGQAMESADREGEYRVNVAVGLGVHGALDESMTRLQAQNEALKDRLAEVEARHEMQLEAIQRRQDQAVAAMQRELAMLREFIAPRVAQEAGQ